MSVFENPSESLVIVKPDPPIRTTNDLVPLITDQTPTYSLDQLTFDFFTQNEPQKTKSTDQDGIFSAKNLF